MAQLDLGGEQRLRDLKGDKMFFKEEMANKLKNYEIFQEGGTRIQVELGRPCTLAEITVNVVQHKKEENLKTFYFNADICVKDAKVEICKAFDESLDPDKNTLYRVDAFEEPSYAVRRVNITFAKNNVNSGELLVLKSDKDLQPHEKFKMSVHLTTTGLSDDSQYLEDIDVPRESTLDELKETVLDLPSLAAYVGNAENHEFVRLREKQSNGFFGRIFRDGSKTLKQHGIKDRCSLVIQLLPEAEVLGPNDYVLFFSRRDTASRTYIETRQEKINAKKIEELQMKALEIFGGEDSTVQSIKIVKHVPHQFMWRELDPEEQVTIKVKKKSEKHRLGDLDLSKPPILLKDGDHIGVLVDGGATDDLQTEADKDAAEAFRIQKEQEKAEKAKRAAQKRVF